MNCQNGEAQKTYGRHGSSRHPASRPLGLVAPSVQLTSEDVDRGDHDAGPGIEESREEGEDLGRRQLFQVVVVSSLVIVKGLPVLIR